MYKELVRRQSIYVSKVPLRIAWCHLPSICVLHVSGAVVAVSILCSSLTVSFICRFYLLQHNKDAVIMGHKLTIMALMVSLYEYQQFPELTQVAWLKNILLRTTQ
jgi:hypothetical protein